MKKILSIIAVALALTGVVFIQNRFQGGDTESPAQIKLDSLTTDQKIGQLFIVGIEGKDLTEETESFIRRFHPGGILLLGKNVRDKDQIKELIKDLQEVALSDAGLPLLIAIDQEGGIISRVKWLDNTPQNEIESQDEAYGLGLARGQGLKELGVNLNLAPLVDAGSDGDFIFNRTFQKSEEISGNLASKLIEGQKEGGIFTAIKHFPGYGGISFNPEDERSVLDNIPSLGQFQKAAESFPEIVMVTDVIYKDIDPSAPFVFSKKGIDFLKDKIPGNYLIISDDLDQYTFLNNYSLSDIVTLPTKAGVDLLIFSGFRLTSDMGIGAFKEAVLEGKIKEDELNNKVLRILELKEKIK